MRNVKLIYLISVFFIIILFFATTGHLTQMISKKLSHKWPTDWRPYGGYVDEILFVVFTETEVPLAMLALQNGDIDAYDERVLQDYVASLVNNPNIDVTFTPSVRYRALTLNCDRFPQISLPFGEQWPLDLTNTEPTLNASEELASLKTATFHSLQQNGKLKAYYQCTIMRLTSYQATNLSKMLVLLT
ncbi:MAG: hypothetical protein ACFFDT_17210 [Candidatus Hodarchaeota archaeon]